MSAQIQAPGIRSLEFVHRGKVRDVYAIDDETLLLVATDRISAFDCVLPTLIPDKGKVLTQMSTFWFKKLRGIFPNHLISTNVSSLDVTEPERAYLEGRSSIVRRTEVFPVECVVRGYLEGSGWKDYKATGKVSGHTLPPGLKHCERIHEPIFTPSTKAVSGHDENINGLEFRQRVGTETGKLLRTVSLKLYDTAARYALSRGIIIADTKFEFGRDGDGNVLLIDEVLTPDSSRFWDAEKYEPGHPQPSLDKQFVREYLETLDWDKTPPAPALPAHIVEATRQRYIDAYELLTGENFAG
jgi:phosphoribosylaminoimidazole-succinocarboxamide synthase